MSTSIKLALNSALSPVAKAFQGHVDLPPIETYSTESTLDGWVDKYHKEPDLPGGVSVGFGWDDALRVTQCPRKLRATNWLDWPMPGTTK